MCMCLKMGRMMKRIGVEQMRKMSLVSWSWCMRGKKRQGMCSWQWPQRDWLSCVWFPQVHECGQRGSAFRVHRRISWQEPFPNIVVNLHWYMQLVDTSEHHERVSLKSIERYLSQRKRARRIQLSMKSTSTSSYQAACTVEIYYQFRRHSRWLGSKYSVSIIVDRARTCSSNTIKPYGYPSRSSQELCEYATTMEASSIKAT